MGRTTTAATTGAPPASGSAPAGSARAGIGEILRQWGRIGCTGFGGPPAHIALLRELCLERRRWLSEADFEHALAACNLLPGPASTQLAIFCAWRAGGGAAAALVGGLAFILPGLLAILALAVVFLAGSPPAWVAGAGAGAGAAVAAVAVRAGAELAPASWRRAPARGRWLVYALLGALAAATLGPWLVLVLLACGLAEVSLGRRPSGGRGLSARLSLLLAPPPLLAPLARARGAGAVATAAATVAGTGGLLALAWVAFKVGALAFGGGFVIVPLMQSEAVAHHHWMTGTQFLNAVALGQVTPGPIVQTVAVVGYAAAGLPGGLLAGAIAFAPSFAFVLLGAPHFERLRASPRARAFLAGAGPAAIGAILGAAVPLALALREPWQAAILAGAALALFLLRRGVVAVLLCAGALGALLGLLGAPLP